MSMNTSRRGPAIDPASVSHLEVAVTKAREGALQRSIQTTPARDQALVVADLLAYLKESVALLDEATCAVANLRVAIIRGLLGLGMTMEDIGIALGLSRQRVSQLLRSSRKPQ